MSGKKLEYKQRIVSIQGTPCLEVVFNEPVQNVSIPLKQILNHLGDFFSPTVTDFSPPHNLPTKEQNLEQSSPVSDPKMMAL